MKHTASKYLKLSFYSNCLNQDGPLLQVNKCNGLKVGSLVKFEARIELKECPNDPDEWNEFFQIYPVGIDESLMVNISMLCDCPCEHPGDEDLYAEKSSDCNTFGLYQCGICDCDKSHYGEKCACDINSIRSDVNDKLSSKGCRPDNSTTIDCTGRGECICGKCQCYPGYLFGQIFSGQFCECDNLSCDRYKGEICSGPDHGTCDCGKCKCEPGWAGDVCECTESADNCTKIGSTEICSGHGDCICGQCVCKDDADGNHYSGLYCDRHITSAANCKQLKYCVVCRSYKQYEKISKEECETNCTWFELQLTDNITMNDELHESICYEQDGNGCNFEFLYKYNQSGKFSVEAKKEPSCHLSLNVLGIALSLISAIVLIGLATLLAWKILTYIQYRREFARFEKERANNKWIDNKNPIYKPSSKPNLVFIPVSDSQPEVELKTVANLDMDSAFE